MYRKVLKLIMQKLASWAIKKHDMSLIVITGFYGSEVVKEGIFHILNQKYDVRRNTNQILWDMAIPLAVLGYADKRRNALGWISLISKATLYLLLGKKHKHILVLNANCTFKETAHFWANFLKPDYLVILNKYDESPMISALLANTKQDQGVVIYNVDEVADVDFAKVNASKILNISKKNGDLIYNENEHTIKYNKGKVKVSSNVPKVIMPLIAAIYGSLVAFGYTLEEVSFEAMKFDLGKVLINKIKTNIGKERPL